MKKITVKGFTLIELIIVMATFGIIMFGAMSLMRPVSKTMIQSETFEHSGAAIQSVTTCLENELSGVEFLDAYNYALATPTAREQAAQDFVEHYYEGVLKSGSGDGNVGSPSVEYGSGRVHVMVIDNTPDATGVVNSVIKKYVYNVGADGFKPDHISVTQDTSATVESAVNKAYYDNFNFQIKLGDWDETTFTLTPLTDTTFKDSIKPGDVSFTIKSSTNKMINGQVYSYFSHASMAMVNINKHNLADLNYYVIDDNDTGTDPLDTSDNVRSIVQIAANSTPKSAASPLGRTNGKLSEFLRVPPVPFVASGTALDSYTFIYSYGAEIDTN